MALVPRRIWKLMSPADQALHTPDDTPEELARVPAPDLKGQETPRSDKATTIRKGHPDWTLFLPGGRVVLMEMKVPGGSFSSEQLGAIGLLEELDHQVWIPDSAHQAIEIVQQFL